MVEPESAGRLLHALPGGVVACDPLGMVRYINPEARRLLALPAGAAEGMEGPRLLPELDWQAALAGEAVDAVRAVGAGRALARVAPLRENGRPAGAVALLCEAAATAAPEAADRPDTDPFALLVGQSAVMAELRRQGLLAARSRATVLLLGESGTGKEVVAKAIHRASGRRTGPFVSVNCAAIPDGLLEAEFFGYADGAFTGARRGGKPGKFEQAAGGTLFLDEIGDLALPLQAKLLRALQERAVERVGGVNTQPVDVRILAASNQPLADMVAAGTFRADLYYRLNVLTLLLPPLRERMEDLPLLVRYLLQQMGAPRQVSPEVLAWFGSHPWPGNVRELENVLERAVALEPGPTLQVDHLPEYLLQSIGTVSPWRQHRRSAERKALLEALDQAGGNKSRAARLLGLSRSRFYEKLRELS